MVVAKVVVQLEAPRLQVRIEDRGDAKFAE
jgi:hypothetical protein